MPHSADPAEQRFHQRWPHSRVNIGR
jgi:hypothetical protein